jgi:hypothetical protein
MRRKRGAHDNEVKPEEVAGRPEPSQEGGGDGAVGGGGGKGAVGGGGVGLDGEGAGLGPPPPPPRIWRWERRRGVREEGHTGEGGASSGRCGTRRGKGEWAGGRGVE